ncbi:hypothetical protein AK830_g622 [Neonectria ditissima]|uniref:Uncharacterized protein n=1 Tax=Neonectria ditissima TaxID=78410 RepID=A0A0P7BPJ5_9HYPO|nr:hypothetical protein AK830_g622 [Neonectria ditissima]
MPPLQSLSPGRPAPRTSVIWNWALAFVCLLFLTFVFLGAAKLALRRGHEPEEQLLFKKQFQSASLLGGGVDHTGASILSAASDAQNLVPVGVAPFESSAAAPQLLPLENLAKGQERNVKALSGRLVTASNQSVATNLAAPGGPDQRGASNDAPRDSPEGVMPISLSLAVETVIGNTIDQ